MTLIFESSFQNDIATEEILSLAEQTRGIEEDGYMHAVFFAATENRAEIDALIERFSVGRSLGRISRVALAAMRLSIAEMLYLPEPYRSDIPFWVSINEALELVKRYDHDVPPRFVNGILNAVAKDAGLKSERQGGES